MPEKDVLLSIDTMARVEKTIKIDGEEYPIMDPYDFGLKAQADLSQVGRSIEELLKTNIDANLRKATRSLDSFVLAIMPGLPKPVFQNLKEAHKLAIMRSFLNLIEQVNKDDQVGTQTYNQKEEEFFDLGIETTPEARVANMVRQIGAG